MKSFSRLLFIIAITLFSYSAYSQDANKQLALSKANEAVKLMDEQKKFDEAIKLLEEAQLLDSDNIDYPYEIAYAYTAKKEYKKASDILEQLLNHKNVRDQVYQMLGNAYDYQGLPDKAMEIYKKGIELFPKSGVLYLEMGNMSVAKKEYNKALASYEKGIEVQPTFPSNYYWAAKLFCNSEEEVWGVIYGEIFMNLERTTQRTAEISKLLFDTYNKAITFESEKKFAVSFCKNATISMEALKDPSKFKLPYGQTVYEPILMMAIIGEKSIDINSLDRIRTRFIDSYTKNETSTKYPNVLFDFQKKISDAGHFEAYNHWLLMKGDEGNFNEWKKDNNIKWESFVQWYRSNKLQLNDTNKFYRAQY